MKDGCFTITEPSPRIVISQTRSNSAANDLAKVVFDLDWGLRSRGSSVVLAVFVVAIVITDIVS